MDEVKIELVLHGNKPIDYANAMINLIIDVECNPSEIKDAFRQNVYMLGEVAEHISIMAETMKKIHSI